MSNFAARTKRPKASGCFWGGLLPYDLVVRGWPVCLVRPMMSREPTPECRAMMKARIFVCLFSAMWLLGCKPAWESMSAPDIQGANAMVGVSNFLSAHGWNMMTNGSPFWTPPAASISNLPWSSLSGHQYLAVTQDGILYVALGGWHHDVYGIAFNPQTNHFASTVLAFTPIGGHWYDWFQPEFQSETNFRRTYE